MTTRWYVEEKVAFQHAAEMRREAENERLARVAEEGAAGPAALPRLFGWLGEHAGTLLRRAETRVARSGSLATQRLSYLDNPDPYRNCATC